MGALMTEAKWNGDTSIHRGWQGGTETKTREMKLLRDDVGVPSVSRSLGGFVGDFPRAKRPAKIRGILRWVVMEDVVQKLMDIFFHIGETCLDLLFMDLMPFEKDLFVQYTNTQKSIQTYPDGMLRMATWTRNHV